MSTPVYMDIEQAYSIVQWAGEVYGHRNLWSALKSMEENWDDLDKQERTAYNMIKKDIITTMGANA